MNNKKGEDNLERTHKEEKVEEKIIKSVRDKNHKSSSKNKTIKKSGRNGLDDTTKNNKQSKVTFKRYLRNILISIGVAFWVFAAFNIAQFIFLGLFKLYFFLNLPSFLNIQNENMTQSIISAIVYLLTLVITIFVPYLVFKNKTTLKELGFTKKLPEWSDVGLAMLLYVVCFFGVVVANLVIMQLFPEYNIEQAQKTGFSADLVTSRHQLLLVYISLALVAPICEELLFRGYILGKTLKKVGAFWAILITALFFGAMHLGIVNVLIGSMKASEMQWNVFITTSILGLGLGFLRYYTKSLWSPVLLHMTQNTIAFLILFVLPFTTGIGIGY